MPTTKLFYEEWRYWVAIAFITSGMMLFRNLPLWWSFTAYVVLWIGIGFYVENDRRLRA